MADWKNAWDDRSQGKEGRESKRRHRPILSIRLSLSRSHSSRMRVQCLFLCLYVVSRPFVSPSRPNVDPGHKRPLVCHMLPVYRHYHHHQSFTVLTQLHPIHPSSVYTRPRNWLLLFLVQARDIGGTYRCKGEASPGGPEVVSVRVMDCCSSEGGGSSGDCRGKCRGVGIL